ncbi:hypothetical protein D4764_02G0003810 [Takifugu flavidus]|uniref:Uncharacterized protein n=1 Tax=Takifugu flavidus TaxID=433684 RepID=A0A5C6NME6_9TELE|nr:hypothetical protein D4764_02G0003810 [Takifugu flavidus]
MKGQRSVQLEDYFSDLQLFHDHVKMFMRMERYGEPAFTDREMYRLKKMLLTQRHGVKVGTGSLYTVEEVALAVGEKIGHGSVKSAARMNGAVVLFV